MVRIFFFVRCPLSVGPFVRSWLSVDRRSLTVYVVRQVCPSVPLSHRCRRRWRSFTDNGQRSTDNSSVRCHRQESVLEFVRRSLRGALERGIAL